MLKPIVPYIEYSINKEYIAKVLCENKDKPQMHCEGSCYLKKQLKKASDNESEDTIPTINLNDYPIALTKNEDIHFQLFLFDVKDFCFLHKTYTKDVYFNIFHPPLIDKA